jgi:hypothetical protein
MLVMKVRAFWNIAPCSLVGVIYVSKVHTAPIIRVITLMMETLRTSETSLYSETAERCVPKSCHLHTRRRENLKSHN